MSDFLRREGITRPRGLSRRSTSPRDLDLVVVGNAISRGNPELEEVLDRKIRYCSLPEAIRDHFLWGARSIVIAGTHGKTTTTSLTGWLLTHGGADPSVLVGGIARELRREGELPHRRRPRVRHRGRRVRQRVLRQDREVPEVPARHRRRQQHRVRSRRHLPRPRRRAAGVPAPREPGAAPRAAAARRRQPRRARRCARAAQCRVETFGLSRRRRLAGARSAARRRRRRTFSVRRSGDAVRRVRRAAARRATTCATRWPRSPSAPRVGLDADTIARRAARASRACKRRLRASSATRARRRRSTTTSRIIRRRSPRRCAAVRARVSRPARSGRSSSRARPRRAGASSRTTSRARSPTADRGRARLRCSARSLPEDERLSAEQLVADLKAPAVDARYIPRRRRHRRDRGARSAATATSSS